MQIEDMGNYHKVTTSASISSCPLSYSACVPQGLEYIRRLSFNQADKNMKKYGKLLMQEAPEITTKFLMELCTDYKPTVGVLLAYTSTD